ncbi:MAG: O-antigen ligase family protein [Candidatus Aminicenantes bacterium]|nr:MAG: O-antigen ligase family protein [Candidatus Aminicenantes bacterium]
MRSKHDDIEICAIDVLYGLVVLITLLSFLFFSKQRLLFHQAYSVFATFILYLLVRFSYKRYVYNKLTWLVSFLVGIAGIEAIRGLIQLLSGSQMKGLFFNVNHFAMYIALNIPLAIVLTSRKKRRSLIQLLFFSILGLLVVCVILSKCRTVYAGLILTLLLMLFIRHGHIFKLIYFRSSRYILFAWSLVSVIIIGTAAVLIYYLKPLSAIGRILVWKVSLQMFSEFPILGVGFNNFSSMYNLYQGRFFNQGLGTEMERLSASFVSYAFNDYLESVVEFGIFGLIIFVFFWYLIIRSVWYGFHRFYIPKEQKTLPDLKKKKSDEAPPTLAVSQIPTRVTDRAKLVKDSLTLGLAGSVMLYMIMSFFYYPSRIIPIYLVFNICLACVVSENLKFRAETSCLASNGRLKLSGVRELLQKFRVPRRLRCQILIIFSLLAFLVSALFLPSFYKQFEAERKWQTGRILSEKGNNSEALELYNRLYPILKWDGNFLHHYGRILLNTGNTKETIKYLEQAKEFWPNPYLLEDLAVAHERDGNLDGAISNASLASSILPWRLTSKFLLANFYNTKGDITNAAEYARLVMDTPMKIWTEEGEGLKESAWIFKQDLDSAFKLPRTPQEEAVSLLPAIYRYDVMNALKAAGENAGQLIKAIRSVNQEKREALAFLLANMPESDLKTLSTDFLLANVRYAFKARSELLFNRIIPEDIFLNYVVPYAVLNERRDNWRPFFYDKFIEIIRTSPSCEEALMNLNRDLFNMFRIVFLNIDIYSSMNSPFESIEKGYASCLELAILFIDACRAVGIPARLAIIPQWPHLNLGHAWSEVYVNGQWQCFGAFDPARLDGIVERRVALRVDTSKAEHRIYAVSFKKTDIQMTFWEDISFIDTTERYVSYDERK